MSEKEIEQPDSIRPDYQVYKKTILDVTDLLTERGFTVLTGENLLTEVIGVLRQSPIAVVKKTRRYYEP